MRLNPNALDEFSHLAQSAIGSLDEFVELDGEGALDFGDYNVVYEAIRSILTRSQVHLPNPFFWRLGRPFEIAVHLGHVSSDYLDLFNRIVDATRQIPFVPSFDDSQSWLAALRIAERYRRTKPEPLFPLNAFSRGATVAQALGRLKERGSSYEMNSTGVKLSQLSFRKVCDDISKLVQNIGGFTVVNNIFRILHESGRTYRGLFLFGRSTTQLPAPHEPNVPWHFIYNLAIKHLAARQTSFDPLTDWADLIRLSRDLGASLDVEEYSAFSGISGISPYLINESILDNVLYDELFSFHQWSADVALELFEYWIDALVVEQCSFPIADAKTWIAVSKALLSNADPYQITVMHRLQYLCDGLSETEVTRLLHHLSATPDSVNKEYETPFDTSKRDATTYPSIYIGFDRYLIQPKGMAARALYERLFKLMRDGGDRNLENKLSKALEKVAERLLRHSGATISIVNGHYVYPGTKVVYEVDLVTETDTHIHFLECKRKALTNASRAGASGNALIDISQGFLAMILQITRHEIAMSIMNPLEFKDKTTLGCGGREIERIAVSMLDHGSLQNRMFLRNLIHALLWTTVGSDVPEQNDKLQSVNKVMAELRSNFERLSTLHGEEIGRFLHQYTFGVWWLSIDQLAVLLQQREPLWQALRPIRHLVFGTGDLMAEFASADRLRASQPAA